MNKSKELQNQWKSIRKAQWHYRINSRGVLEHKVTKELIHFLLNINALVLKHFTIGMLSKLWQQVKYEQTKMFDEVVEVVEKEENMEEVPQPIMKSMAKVIQFSTN